MRLFSLYTLCQCHCTEILIPDLGHEAHVCFHAVPCVSITALRSSLWIWDMKHMSVLHCTLWQCHCTKILIPDLGHETHVCFHAVPCVSVTALRSS